MPEQRRDHEVDAEVSALVERAVGRSKMSVTLLGLAATFVIAGSIGAMGLAVSYSARADLAESERALCQRVLNDRIGTIMLRQAQAEGGSHA